MNVPHFEHVEAAVDRAAASLPAVPSAPDWRPLELLLGPALIGQFMAMGEATAPDGTLIVLYKHGMTRRYLNVSADLRTWQYCAPPIGRNRWRPRCCTRSPTPGLRRLAQRRL